MNEPAQSKPLLLRANQRSRRWLWPVIFVNFEHLDNFPKRTYRLLHAIHIGLLGAVSCSASLVFTLFLLLIFAQSGVLDLSSILGNLLLAFQQSLVLLLASIILLFLPVGILLFLALGMARFAGFFSFGDGATIPFLEELNASFLPPLAGGLVLFIFAGFIYLDFDFYRRSSRTEDWWYKFQNFSAQQKKTNSTLLALEILHNQFWNIPLFKDFFLEQLMQAIELNAAEDQGRDLLDALARNELTQESASLLLAQQLRAKLKPKTRTRRRSADKSPKIASA